MWIACALLIIAGCSNDAPQTDMAQAFAAGSTMTFATGSPAGIYYPFGGGLASLWSSHLEGVNMKAEVTGASLINVVQVARGESEVGIAMADVLTSAYLGTNQFPQPLPVRALFSAYPNFIHLVTLTDRDIRSVHELVGRRVSIGAPGSGTAIAAENVLLGHGIDIATLDAHYLDFGGTADGLKDGTLDAAFIVGGLGIGVVKELALTRDVALVPISAADFGAFGAKFAAYKPAFLPAGTYHGNEQPIETLAVWNVVVVNAAMPEMLAYRLLCVLYQQRTALEKIVAVASYTTLENLDGLPAVPLHPGAVRYLERVKASTAAELDCGG